MELVDQIIELLSSDKPSLENALFKAQVLAHRLGEADLKQWVERELKGYPKGAELPAYRMLHLTVMGTCSNGAYRYNEQPLPVMHLDERVRDMLQVKRLSQSISVIEKWAAEEDNITSIIAPEFFPMLSEGMANGFEVERAWGKHSQGAMLQVVTEVRSRLLDLALALSDRLPNQMDPAEMKSVSKDINAGDIFKNVVFGHNATIVIGSDNSQQSSSAVTINDLAALEAALRRAEVSEADISELKQAIEADQQAPEVSAKQGFGPKVRGWLGRMMTKAGTTSWKVGVSAAGGLLGRALAHYYGFGA